MKLAYACAFAIVCALLAGATSSPAQEMSKDVPFQPPAFTELFVPDEFIVEFKPEVRSQLIVGRDAQGSLVVSNPAVKRVIDRIGALDFKREFPGMTAQPTGSRFPDLTGYYTVKLMPARSLETAMAEFAADPTVDHVEKIGMHPIDATPNDTYYINPPPSFPNPQWHYWDTFGIDADLAWDTETGDASVVVADLDTGLKYRHSDIGGQDPAGPADNVTQGNVWVNAGEIPGNGIDDDTNAYIDDVIGYDFVSAGGGVGVVCTDVDCGGLDNDPNDGEGHGTHTAGTIVAITNNARAVAGVAGGWSNGTTGGAGTGCKVMPLRIGYRATVNGQPAGVVRMDWCAQAMAYVSTMVDKGVNVAAINCSWGSSNSGGIDAAVNTLLAHDVMIINSAGNSSSSVAPYLGSKAGVMAVAATTQAGGPASFTNFGSWVEVAAPGVNINSTLHVPTDTDTTHMYIGLNSGTSMSAPHVCGVAALLESYNPALSGPDKFSLIENNVIAYSGSLDLGSGIVNARLALNAAPPPCVAPVANFSASQTSGVVPFTVNFTDNSSGSPTSWAWDFGDGGNDNVQNPSHQYTVPGNYTVTLTATNACGNDPEVKVAYIEALDPVGVGDVEVARVFAVEALQNPARSSVSLRIANPRAEAVTVRILDTNGRLVRTLGLSAEAGVRRIDWDGRDQNGHTTGSGLYVVMARAGQATASTKLVMMR
ncbi:MAG TPA: S8 family serine peptidase [Candidatus Eisenbacteria bacterium]|nr:S8 family serine peptidase [Candidatus Eisenbacteria bacterium]